MGYKYCADRGPYALPRVLLVEDESALASMVADALTREHIEIECCEDGERGFALLLSGRFDVAILDWHLPGMTGVEICERARKGGVSIPILMLTGRTTSSDKEQGLDSGADDYLTKPFDVRELVMRIKTLSRRPKTFISNLLQCGDISIALENSQVFKNDQPINLLPAEYSLLEFLMRNRGKAFSAEELLTHVWKADSEVTLYAVTTCIKRLRDKIDSEGRNSILKNVHGIGYMVEV
jgi:DNA-binding response OmpR family regulator